MAEWWSIEIFDAERADGRISAAQWGDTYHDMLVESAVTHGALAWDWHQLSWGVVFEVSFADDERWEAWRRLPAIRAALDAVPDPVNGLVTYRGRGGSSGARVPRRPRISPSAAAVALPEPQEIADEAVRSYVRSRAATRRGEPLPTLAS